MPEERRIRVMIVDDVPVIRQMLAEALGAAGFAICGSARNGQEAVDQVAQVRPDLILLDVVMPQLQGYEALPILKERCPGVIVVMLTSTSERSLVLLCKERGADGFIIKQEGLHDIVAERVRQIYHTRVRKLSRTGD